MKIKENAILGFIKKAISFLLKPLKIYILKGYFKLFSKVIEKDEEGKYFK